MTKTTPDPIVRSEQPYNAEPDRVTLRKSFVTDQADFYVRSHGDIPAIDAATHRLRVTGRVARALDLGMDELRARFATHTIEAVLQCAGNRRADMDAVAPVEGDPWETGAIGNACWTGVALADVLRAAGADDAPGLHVAFSSLDECDVDGKHFTYGASIPIEKAIAPEVLLAFAMNGEPLAPEHGFPLRVVVPGFAGVRSPKWLAAIEVRDTPSENPIQAEDYKLLPGDIRAKEDIDWDRGETIDEMPVNSAICEPAPGAALQAGRVVLRGYAMATGQAVTRVEVSADGGDSWSEAALEPSAPWSWTFWSAALDLAPGAHELTVRAFDAAGATQPARPQDGWNIKGYLCTAWHRVPVTVT